MTPYEQSKTHSTFHKYLTRITFNIRILQFKILNLQIEMESSEEPTSLQSICHLQASELFPKTDILDCEDPSIPVPFILLSGEYVVAMGRTSDGILALSNYRLYLQIGEGSHNVPLGLIEQLEVKEIFYLHISCKDARSIRW